MKYKTFGKTGLRVSELALGAMTFGEEVAWGSGKEESRKVFDAFAEAGGNFIDTANVYTQGTSERFVGEFMGSDRERFVLATKFVFSTDSRDPNASGSHRKNMTQAVEASLRRLQTDYVDILWAHAYDRYTPMEEVMRAFDDLVHQGKVLYPGISDAPAWIVAHANTLAALRGWSPFAGLQIEYSLIQRTVERDLLPMAEYFGLCVTAWSPLGSGLLSGKYRASATAAGKKRLDIAPFVQKDERNLSIADAVSEVAKTLGWTPSQVALSWVRGKAPYIVPIIGARTEKQLQENLHCLECSLSGEHRQRLDEVSDVGQGFPHEFLRWVHGGITGDGDLERMF
ncbi:MAG: aldo/keto reductase [Bacteroidetes bacterium]|nr:aldo/keto reductase [Bacteroidota bacterium]